MKQMIDQSTERDLVLRYCTRYTGDPDAAEDLTQQTLLQAWRHEHTLRDPEARRGWLLAIARNVCLMWGRSRSRAIGWQAGMSEAGEGAIEDLPDEGIDLELELERDELAVLLDRALALLPSDVRDLLVRRYLEELPQAEVAARLGLSEGAVEARIHRGKLALRRVLLTEFSDDAIAHGLIRPEDAGWQETRIWCPGCGRRRLEIQMDTDQGTLNARCLGCTLPYYGAGYYIRSQMGPELQDMRTYRPAVGRVLGAIHRLRTRVVDGHVLCESCDARLPVERVDEFSYAVRCPVCGWIDAESWHSLTWSLPQVRAFWQAHPRMQFLLGRSVEAEGAPARVTGFESIDGSARIEVVTREDDLRVLAVHGAPEQP